MRYARPYWKTILLLSVISIILSGIALINPYLVKLLIDDVFIGKDFRLLTILMLIFIASYFIGSIVRIFYAYKVEYLGENLVLGVKTQLFKHLEELDLGFYDKRKAGDILFRIDQDVYSIQDFISVIIDDILMNTLMAGFILIVCFYLSWKVTLASLLFFPFYILAQKYFGERLKKQQQKLINKNASILSFLQEFINSIKAIQTFVLEKISLNKYRRSSKRLIKIGVKTSVMEEVAGAAIGLITFTPLMIILWYGGYKVMNGVITVGSLMALYTYITKLFEPISEIGSANISIQMALVSINRVFQFLDTKPRVINKKDAIPITTVKGKIEFNKVKFRYNEEEPVLEGISFEIEPNKITGLVGPSGAGKSTVASLICRFYDPQNGQVLLDGKNLKDLDLGSLRKNIGIVSQETILMNMSIKDNIKFGNQSAKDKDVINAAKLANIHDTIKQLEKGYDTIVGERGVTLSGGEKQRISIARTILKDPKIIILDEGTSSLDAETETNIQEALKHITKNKTTIIIAHRLSTILNTDKIIVLKDHKVVESGDFISLVKKKGLFYKLYKLQLGGLKNKKE